MSGRRALPVGRAKKVLVSISIAVALIGMALFGGPSTPAAQAQTSNSAAPTAAERAKLLAEQTQPQKEVPFNPADFDKFVGYYKLSNPEAFAHVFRNGAHYYVQLTGQQPVENFPESPTEFFATVVAAQVSFVSGPSGQVTEMLLHQNGFLRPWLRSSKSANDAFKARLRERLQDSKPSPGTEASLRRFITSWEEKGRPDYDDMEPVLAEAAREQAPQTAHIIQQLGAFESLRFVRVSPIGMDIYLGTFAHGHAEFTIAPLDVNGKVVGQRWQVLP